MQYNFSIYRWVAPNAGDVALFEALKSLFPADTKWTEIDLWTSFEEAIHRINLTDGFIIGGGTILGNLNTFVMHRDFSTQLRVPACLIGTGIRDEGRNNIDIDKRDALSALLTLCEPVGLRGQLSLDLLQQSGIENPNFEITGDVALALKRKNRPSRGIGINIRPRREGGHESTVALMQNLLRSGALERFGPIEFFSCHDKWDLQPAKTLGVPIVPYDGLESFLDRLASYELVVSERLHGAVLAHTLGRPTVQLSYERKCHDYMNSVNCADLCLDQPTPEELLSACDRALATCGRFVDPITNYRTTLQSVVDRFLRRIQNPTFSTL